MKRDPVCPRCFGPLTEPSAWASRWRCPVHGVVYPLWPAHNPTQEGLRGLLRDPAVPVWLPWPLPSGWLVTGFAGAGDDPSGTRACVVAVSGPSPVGGLGDMLVVSEEPGVGLGAAFAGLKGPDPGEGFATATPHALVSYGNHEFPLWHVEAPGRAAFAGEVLGNWVWVVLWPDTAGVLLLEPLPVRDLRDPGQHLDLPFGAMSPRLRVTGGH
ncbi:MAG TPA: DUF6758 family protein [Streptosporangiaceae bacterium]|nr:DUF6758 family protein [Streptosporangiaceae bacterium]